ncbi:MAG: M24 family metallopeptidase, partial [Armatimonadota bacterium]
MTRQEEVADKLARVRAYMSQKGLDAVLLRTQANFAWITAGGHSHVATATDAGVADVIVTPESALILTNNIEACRLEEEEVADLGLDMRSFSWWEDAAAELDGLLAGRAVGTDALGPGDNVAADLARLRWGLTPSEVERYRYAGEVVGRALGTVAREIRPGDTEGLIAGKLAQELMAGGLIPGVVLVATDERAFKWRHPIPRRTKTLEKYAMLVVCGRWQGLWACATRLVHFGEPGDDLRAKLLACATVDATFIANTTPGAQVKEVWEKALAAYADGGWPQEWQYHHQGGACGYAPRDYRATPTLDETVLENQAFAWNPTLQGT